MPCGVFSSASPRCPHSESFDFHLESRSVDRERRVSTRSRASITFVGLLEDEDDDDNGGRVGAGKFYGLAHKGVEREDGGGGRSEQRLPSDQREVYVRLSISMRGSVPRSIVAGIVTEECPRCAQQLRTVPSFPSPSPSLLSSPPPLPVS